MSDKASVNFAKAHKALQKAAAAAPEWFDRARDALRRSDNGEVLLVHAMLDALREAYEAGRGGKPPPPLKLVQPSTRSGDAEMIAEKRVLSRTVARTPPAAVKQPARTINRRTIKPPVEVEDDPKPVVRRVVRPAR